MPRIEVENVHVDFPFQPYPAQVTYMEKVVAALKDRTNALLESPTGTGKTLSLLCSTLAWQQTYSPERDGASSCCGNGGTGISNGSMTLMYETDAGKPRSFPPTSGAGINNHVKGVQGRPVIVYASRTHSQLRQVIRELKATGYRPHTVILGSREQLCVHPEVSKLKGGLQNRRCGVLTQSRACRYKNNLDSYQAEHVGGGSPGVMDIEELKSLGQTKLVCPYYLMRQNTLHADLVLMPYNYLLDAGSRQPYQVRWTNSVVIFDEAHNLEGVASEAWSLALSTTMTARISEELEKAWEIVKVKGEGVVSKGGEKGGGKAGGAAYGTPAPTKEDLVWLKRAFRALEEGIDAIQLTVTGGYKPPSFSSSHVPAKSAVLGPQKLQDLFYGAGLGGLQPVDFHAVVSRLERTINFLMDDAIVGGGNEGGMGIVSTLFTGGALEAFLKAYKMIYFWGDTLTMRKNMQAYRLYIESGGPSLSLTTGAGQRPLGTGGRGQGSGGKRRSSFPPVAQDPPRRVLHYWCFCPGIALEQLLQLSVRSVLLTSGTLSPLDSFASELRIPFPVRLENQHVIDTSVQTFMSILSRGPRGETLSSSFQRRGEDGYLADLGESLIRVARGVPGGMLVFFPSYGVMDLCLRQWKKGEGKGAGGGVYERLQRVKTVVEEPRKAAELPACILAYDGAIKEEGGAILLAVCRGKVSEGMDFADQRARAVVITGIPFPPARDPRVGLKKMYLDSLASSPASVPSSIQPLRGMEWYQQQAARAVNQAVGRVIRHQNDYGIVLFLDERFAAPAQRASLSQWVRPHVSMATNFEEAMEGIRKFFVRVKGISRLLPRRRVGAGARASGTRGGKEGDEDEFDEEWEEEEDGKWNAMESVQVSGRNRKGAGFRARNRGAVVVNVTKVDVDAGYIAPEAIEQEFLPSSQAGIGGKKVALQRFLEFKSALKQQERVTQVMEGKPLGPRPSTLSLLLARKEAVLSKDSGSTGAVSDRESLREASDCEVRSPRKIATSAKCGTSLRKTKRETVGIPGKESLMRQASLSEQLGLTRSGSASDSSTSSCPSSFQDSTNFIPGVRVCGIASGGSNGDGEKAADKLMIGKQQRSSFSFPSSVSPSSVCFVPPSLTRPRKASALNSSISAVMVDLRRDEQDVDGPKEDGAEDGGDNNTARGRQGEILLQKTGPPSPVRSHIQIPSHQSPGPQGNRTLLKNAENCSGCSTEELVAIPPSVSTCSSHGLHNMGERAVQSKNKGDKVEIVDGATKLNGFRKKEERPGKSGGEQKAELDFVEMQEWLEGAKAKLSPDRLLILQDRVKEVLRGKVQSLKDFQAWTSAAKGGAVDVFLSTGADPTFLSRFAQSYLSSFLRPVFDGMVKTRYKPYSRTPLARIGARSASVTGMVATIEQDPNSSGKTNVFIAPGGEEEYLVCRPAKKVKETNNIKWEGEKTYDKKSIITQNGVEIGSRDEEVIERLQHLVDQGLGGSRSGSKKMKAKEENGSHGNRQQKCPICDETSRVFVSQCGHTACMPCWKRWLNKKGREEKGAKVGLCFYKCGPVTISSLRRVLAGPVKDAALRIVRADKH